MFDSQNMEHADINLPTPQVAANHPFKNPTNHARLLKYITDRLAKSKQVRDSRLGRLVQIDREVAGWINLSYDDRERLKQEKQDGVPQATKMNLPLTFIHLDDMMTYFIQTFAPTRGMFYHTGSPDDSESAQQIVTLMNNHAIYGGYYREVLKTLFGILKYQKSGFHAYWAKDFGPSLSKDPDGKDVIKTDIIWQGNRITALDEYNILVDPSCHVSDLHREGEWAAHAMMKSHYWLKVRASQGMYFNCEDLLKKDNGVSKGDYYVNPPERSQLNLNDSVSSDTDWVAVVSGTPEHWHGSGFELVECYIKLNPVQMNLIPRNQTNRNQYEIWRITIANGETIIDATYMNNCHGHLPFYFGVIKDDSMNDANKSTAEILSPLSKFGSFLLNAHIEGTRKNLYGLTIYDPSMINMDEIPAGEVAARVPLKAGGYGKDVRTAYHRDTQTVDTEQTMQDLKAVLEVIDKFFPTQSMPSQIAGIDRAIDSQVAAVQQGANRRMQKDARLIDDTLFRPFRFCCYYNIIQYQPDNTTVNDFYGKQVDIDLGKLRTTDLPFIVGQGLKAIDLQAAAGRLQQIIFALIQNPQAAQQIDLLGLIDYWTSLVDIDVNMKQFHIQQPGAQPGIPGAPATPVTAPGAVTAPLAKSGVVAPAGGA